MASRQVTASRKKCCAALGHTVTQKRDLLRCAKTTRSIRSCSVQKMASRPICPHAVRCLGVRNLVERVVTPSVFTTLHENTHTEVSKRSFTPLPRPVITVISPIRIETRSQTAEIILAHFHIRRYVGVGHIKVSRSRPQSRWMSSKRICPLRATTT